MISSVTVLPPCVTSTLSYHHLIISAVCSHQPFVQSSRPCQGHAPVGKEYPAGGSVMIGISESPTPSEDLLPSSCQYQAFLAHDTEPRKPIDRINITPSTNRLTGSTPIRSDYHPLIRFEPKNHDEHPILRDTRLRLREWNHSTFRQALLSRSKPRTIQDRSCNHLLPGPPAANT